MKSKLLVAFLIIIIVGGVWFHYENEKSAWNAVFTWSGISALPTWAANAKIKTRGNPFTRTFLVTFSGSREQIEEWMHTEPALQKIKSEKVSKSDQILYEMYLNGNPEEAQKR